MDVLTFARARTLTAGFDTVSAVILGDVMIDQFVVGHVDRISPEAPVPVVMFDHEEYRAGGAANVAHNMVALGGHVTLLGVVGADEAAARLKRELASRGIGTSDLVEDMGRPTTRKLRVVTDRNQQVARIDYEVDTEVTGEIEQALAARLADLAGSARVIVVSDYLKGAISKRLVRLAVDTARRRAIPVVVDPKIPHIDYYAGATLITPNHHEAEVATHARVRTDEEAATAARIFQERADCVRVLITRGEHGMCLLDGSKVVHLPAIAREVSDVTGAGDTVIGTLALGLAAGATPLEAAVLANHAASVVVGRFGPATLTSGELLATFERDQ
jgi:D-beta-D-heptose 7-phosphate kinase/D-beta-D-heptose 1-phosphate adenosyltransferase